MEQEMLLEGQKRNQGRQPGKFGSYATTKEFDTEGFRICPRCGERKDRDGYWKSKHSATGYDYNCIACRKIGKEASYERSNGPKKTNGTGRPAVLFVDGLKPCSACKISKPIESYWKSKNTKSGYQHCCKECSKVKQMSLDEKRIYNRAHKYGLTKEQFDVRWQEQDGKCLICLIDMVLGNVNESVHVDHCHTTGKVRGLLCAQCNKGLGHFGDDVEKLKAAIQYLERNGLDAIKQ